MHLPGHQPPARRGPERAGVNRLSQLEPTTATNRDVFPYPGVLLPWTPRTRARRAGLQAGTTRPQLGGTA